MLTFLAIADRYRPKYIVWENVPGVLSSNGGKDFGSFLAALGELGYGWAYRVLDAQWFGVAQRRRRVFVVGCLGDQRRAAQILFECESVRRDTPPSRAKGQGAASNISGGVELCGPLNARDYKYPDTDGMNYNSAKMVPCWWDGGNTAGTLTKQNANGAQRMPDKDNFGAILQPHAFKVRGGCEGGGKGYLGSDDTAFTVATHQDQQIAQPVADVGPTIGSSGPPYSRTGNERVETDALAIQAMQVRRLTPVECERLQGFADSWTNIPWRGKAEAPDGPRYKALGNSMAVPVMRWIGERINKQPC
jgi:DNA (cytosine-5)-methyltransferase 1